MVNDISTVHLTNGIFDMDLLPIILLYGKELQVR